MWLLILDLNATCFVALCLYNVHLVCVSNSLPARVMIYTREQYNEYAFDKTTVYIYCMLNAKYSQLQVLGMGVGSCVGMGVGTWVGASRGFDTLSA